VIWGHWLFFRASTAPTPDTDQKVQKQSQTFLHFT
jgi:hypothetical protein